MKKILLISSVALITFCLSVSKDAAACNRDCSASKGDKSKTSCSQPSAAVDKSDKRAQMRMTAPATSAKDAKTIDEGRHGRAAMTRERVLRTEESIR